jgi:23S rRNA (guanine1835-N2)-methyltransferase
MADDELILGSHAARGPDEFRFRVRSGTQLVGTGSFRHAELALLEAAAPVRDDDILAVDGNYGVPGIVLGSLAPAGQTTVTETSARCADLISENARQNGVDLDVTLVPAVREVEDTFDLAVFAPRAYDPIAVVTQRAFEALASLRPDGELLIAGEAESGARRIAEHLEASARIEETSDSGSPVYRIERPESVDVPTLVEDRTVRDRICGLDRSFVTQPGLFSPDGIDDGTGQLLEAIDTADKPSDGARVLDLCCGYGAVGATLGGLADISLVLTDDDRRATACAERTLAANELDADVYTADGLRAVDGHFDMIVTNPPTHAGQQVTDALFAGAAAVLSPGGGFWLVYNETMAYEERLDRWFDSVAVLRAEDGYEVARARRLPAKDTA